MINKLEHTLYDFENCLNTVVDDKKTKMNVVGSIFKFGISLTKLTANVAGCAIKNTPKAVVAIAAIKRDIVDDIDSEYTQYQKKLKEDALNKKISELQINRLTL